MALQTLDHAAMALKALRCAGRNGMRLVDLQRALSLTHATTHRLLSSLEEHGFVSQDRTTRVYRLGFELALLGLCASGGLHDVFRSLSQSSFLLAQETGESVFVSACSGREGVCIERQSGKYPIDAVSIGGRTPLGMGAGSQAILAALPQNRADRIIDAVEEQFGEGAEDFQQIRSDISRVRQVGWSVTRGIVSNSTRAIGVAVRDAEGLPVGALVIAGAAQRLSDERIRTLGRTLMRTRSQIEAKALAGISHPRASTRAR